MLEKDHGLIFEVEGSFNSSLERLQICGGKSSCGPQVKEILFEEDTAQSGNLGASSESGDQGLGELRRVSCELSLDVGLGALSDSIISAEKFLESGLHY
jgi:hypothetical protein